MQSGNAITNHPQFVLELETDMSLSRAFILIILLLIGVACIQVDDKRPTPPVIKQCILVEIHEFSPTVPIGVVNKIPFE